MFLFSLDFSSRIHRKNPEALIKAFKIQSAAFPEKNEDVVLVIKSKWVKTVEQQVNDYRMLEEWIQGDPRIRLINETYTRDSLQERVKLWSVINGV